MKRNFSRIGRQLRFMSGNAKRTLRRFGNLRYSRLGSLRYVGGRYVGGRYVGGVGIGEGDIF
jgi:hypothetical protein